MSTLVLGGCAGNPDHAATRPVILNAPAEQANSDYWFKQPNVASVSYPDFEKLWNACSDTLIFDQFEIDRQDRRFGVMMTFPLISKQFFEVWRSDAGDAHEVALDSLQTIRRTVRFDFARDEAGSYVAYPKVLLEQLSHPERRITAEAQFSQAFAATNELPSRVTEEGAVVPNRYWYSIGRDGAMEKQLARAILQRLGEKPEARNPNDESSQKAQ
jgi:hypothetical protein